MGRLQGENQPLGAGEQFEGLEGLPVAHPKELDAPALSQVGELGPDAGVIQPCGDRVGGQDLAVFVEQEQGLVALDDPRAARAAHAGGMLSGSGSPAPRFGPDQPRPGSFDEGGEEADGVGAPAHAGHQRFNLQTPLPDLELGLPADHGLELPHHRRVRRGTQGGAEQVVGIGIAGGPVAQGFVDRVLQGTGPPPHGNHLGPEALHPEDVGPLAPHVHFAHVHPALQAQLGAHCRRGVAVLSRPGLGDDPALAHAPGQKPLAEGVVDLVSAGVGQPFELDVDPGAPESRGGVFGTQERGGPAHVVGGQPVELGREARVGGGLDIRFLQLVQGAAEHFGHVAAAETAEELVHGLAHRSPPLGIAGPACSTALETS